MENTAKNNVTPINPNQTPLGVRVPARAFAAAVKACLVTMSKDITRPNLAQVLVEVTEKWRLTLVSTDAHRLTKIEVNAPHIGTEAIGMRWHLTPEQAKFIAKTVAQNKPEDISRIGTEHGGIVETAGGNTLKINVESPERFPPYAKAIPAYPDAGKENNAASLIGINAQYAGEAFAMVDGLRKSLKAGSSVGVRMHTADDLAPIKLVANIDGDGGCCAVTVVVMPMRT
jgi:hypothetical protein